MYTYEKKSWTLLVDKVVPSKNSMEGEAFPTAWSPALPPLPAIKWSRSWKGNENLHLTSSIHSWMNIILKLHDNINVHIQLKRLLTENMLLIHGNSRTPSRERNKQNLTCCSAVVIKRRQGNLYAIYTNFRYIICRGKYYSSVTNFSYVAVWSTMESASSFCTTGQSFTLDTCTKSSHS